jgi:hypothetical protein
LDDDELSAVIAHELIHIRNGDTRLIAAANVFLRGLGLLDRVNLFKPRRYRQVAVVLFAPILFPVYLGVALLVQFLKRLGYASRLLISSAREFIADAQAVALTQNPSALVSALRKIQGNSAIVGLLPEQDAMMIDGAAQGALATHPTIGERIQAIVAATGAMALETRPRRDTRTDLERRRGEAGAVSSDGAGSGPDQVRKLVRTALTRAAPAQGGVGAFLRSGANGELGVFGMRWDIAAAMLAAFLTATILHHGDILGFLGQMGHALDRPDANTKPLIDKALACRDAELKALAGGKPSPEACAITEDVVAAAKKFGINVLPDGRVLTNASWRCFRMTSSRRPRHRRPASTPAGSAISTRRTRPAPFASRRHSPGSCARHIRFRCARPCDAWSKGIWGAFCKASNAACWCTLTSASTASGPSHGASPARVRSASAIR